MITDVPGVLVGHANVRGNSAGGGLFTGVTAILPGPSSGTAEGGSKDAFDRKYPAGMYVSNGFGKSLGLVQVDELGCLETPILLTNTLSVGTCFTALAQWALDRHPQIGDTTGTVNPMVMECNDGPINDIRAMGVGIEDAFRAMDAASATFEEGAVGAGSGMTCFGLKGGIGSASRKLTFDGAEFTIGILVMTNFGSLERLRIAGEPIGERICAAQAHETRDGHDKGSIVSVIATDLPLDSRQLKRLAKRVTVGIARCGGYIGNGSGEIVLAFSTANRIDHWAGKSGRPMIDTAARLNDNAMDDCFAAVADMSEEAILRSLLRAHTVVGRTGKPTYCLKDAAARAEVALPDCIRDLCGTCGTCD